MIDRQARRRSKTLEGVLGAVVLGLAGAGIVWLLVDGTPEVAGDGPRQQLARPVSLMK